LQDLRNIAVPLYRWVDGWWQGLRCGWLLVAMAVWLQFRRRSAMSAAVLAGVCVGTIAMAMLIASDIGRSNSALWPAGLLGLLLLLRERPLWVRYGLLVLVVGNLLLPGTNVVTIFSRPISSFYVELELYRHPTGMMSSAAWLDVAETATSEQKPAEALHALDIAVALDDRSAEALARRAIFYFNLNHLDRATQDADAALAIDPTSADAMFIRGMLYSRRGDPKDAVRLLRAALERSPLEWAHRQECRALLGE
jgi:tetratricopeptide (TPR) repeat protein